MGLQLLACLLVLLFMYAFAVPMSLAAVSVGIIFSFTLLSWILDYLKRRTFYRELTGVMEQLGEKYLVSEMVEKPDFYEGEMLWDVLYTTNKSMLENITEREMKTREFTDYVEAWIHEVKIPLASLNLMCRDLDRKYIRQLDRIDRQLDQILYYIRSGNAEKDYLIRRVSLAETVKNVALKNKDDLLERGIALEVNLESDTVMTDGKWLEFMLNQIINNSVKYMKREIDGKSGEMMEHESGKLPVEPGKTPGEEPRIRVTSGAGRERRLSSRVGQRHRHSGGGSPHGLQKNLYRTERTAGSEVHRHGALYRQEPLRQAGTPAGHFLPTGGVYQRDHHLRGKRFLFWWYA